MIAQNQIAEGRLAVNLTVQRSRAIAFFGMYVVALAGRLIGALDFDYRWANALLGTTLASTVVFYQLYRHHLDRGWGIELSVVWMTCDVAFITWMVHLTHSSSDLCLVWYLTNTAAAAFVGGHRASLRVAVANCAAYLLLLVMQGEIRGLDRALGEALIHLALLYAASFFFLRGIADLRDKRLRIRDLARERSKQLEELRRLTAALDRQARELADAHLCSQESSRAKSQFLANMSHELRTPLNSIIGFSEILGERLEDLEPRFKKFLKNILDSGRHLLRLINDILDLSKIEAGKMELSLEKVSLGDVIHGVRSVMLGVVGHRSIKLEVDLAEELPPLIADGPKVKQILYNLISNAIKFSPDGSMVRIAARAVSAKESLLGVHAVEIRVVDQGIGIAPADQIAIFEEFRQVDGEVTRAHGGTGLGLALVQRFAEMHGGIVSLESAAARGSTFIVCLPVDVSRVILTPETARETARETPRETTLADEPAPPASERPEPETAGTLRDSPVVLVVEDDEPFYRALSADLEGAGYRPRWAHNGEQALLLARELRPAAITLDLSLPGIDGWEVLKALKDDTLTAGIPVIIVSLLENSELGFALGAEDYFLKPLERRHFLARLGGLLGDVGATPRPALIIDDDPQVHQLLEEELEEAGYEVLTAGGGAEGLELAAERRPVIIVLDLMMPRMNGFEVAAALRDDPATADIPIVILTAKELTSTDRDRLHGKIQGMLSKAPMDRLLIVRTIREIERRCSDRQRTERPEP